MQTILIADDDAISFLLLKHAFKNLAQSIQWAKNGKEAVNMVTNNHEIDFVLMDIIMPVMDGYEATRKIKLIRPELIIFMQSGCAMPNDRHKAFIAGCDDYISKPIHIKELVQKLQAYTAK
jgi:CheY-like chemotaxis protein